MPAQAIAPGPSGLSLRRGGVALTVFASQLLTSAAARQRVCGQLLNLVASGTPVALRTCDLGSGRHASKAFEQVLSCVATCFDRSSLDPAGIEVTVDAATVSPQIAWRLRRVTLGSGVLNIVVADSPGASANGCLLDALWHLQDAPVFAATWPVTTSPCPLLASEAAADVLPQAGLQVPGQTAWLLAEVNIADWLPDNTAAPFSRLKQHLKYLINAAERVHDNAVWPTAAMQYDGWANRRIGIEVRGVQALLRRWSLDSNSHNDLVVLDDLLQRIKQVLCVESANLARSRELLPAIAASSPLQQLPGCPTRQDWERRWQRAVQRHPLRHRNLLVMSPGSLLPGAEPKPGWLNLLRLLRHADVCSSRRSAEISNLPEYLRFHRQLAAIRQQIEASRVVAEKL